MSGETVIVAAYVCKTCDVEGRDPEITPGWVACWNCGERAQVTARVSSSVMAFGLAMAAAHAAQA